MSDSPQPDEADRASADPDADDEAPEEAASEEAATEARTPSRGVLGDLEDGFGHLMAAFEQGALNLAEEVGKKRREEAESSQDQDGEVQREPERDRGTEPDDDEPHDPADDDAAPLEPREPWPGMTYDEALSPVRWRNLAIGCAAVLILGAMYWGATFLQVRAAADDDETRPADVAVVLGAAQFDGTPSPVLARRLDRALELWNDGQAEFIVTTGSNQEGDRFTEGFSGFVYLREAGVPEDAILTIVDGADTYQQLSATVAQMDERNLTSALLVSEGYHSYRLRSIADDLGLEAYVSPTSIGATTNDYVRETSAVAVGRLLGYRRLSAWATDGDPPG
ncbi:MAG: YdcF family protein [Actinomycetota bacterium]